MIALEVSTILGFNVTPRENFMLAVTHKEPYWLPCPLFDGSVVTVGHNLMERCDDGKDAWGVQWKLKNFSSNSFPVKHPITSPSEIEDYHFPSPDDVKITEDAKDIVSKVDRKKVLLFGDNGWGLFERAWLLLSMPRYFLWSFSHTDALQRLIKRIAEVKIAITEKLIDELDIDVIMYGDDWGMEDRLLMSIEKWRTLIKPWQAELYRVAKKHGVLIYQHSDGKVETLIPDLIEIGVDILNIQRECNDWSKIVEDYGDRITLWGGVSARALDAGDPEEIRREVDECSRLGRHGSIILAPGHSLEYSKEKLEIMHREWMEKGSYRK